MKADLLGLPHCVIGTELDPPPYQNNWKTEQDKETKVFRHSTIQKARTVISEQANRKPTQVPGSCLEALCRCGIVGAHQAKHNHLTGSEKRSEVGKAEGLESEGREQEGGRYTEEELWEPA